MTGPEIRALVFCAAALCSPLAVAAPTEQVLINADNMQLDINTGESIYRGNVRFVQGKIELSGDRIIINSRNGEISQVRVEGKLASYRNANSNGRVVAQSERMEYVVAKNQLTLLGNARLEQDDRVVESQRIIYDTDRQLILAGSQPGTEPGPADRVNITLTPRKDKAP